MSLQLSKVFFVVLLMSVRAYASEPNVCTEKETQLVTEQLDKLYESHKSTFKIRRVTDLLNPNIRKTVRQYYKINNQCFSVTGFRRLTAYLLKSGFPPKYIPGMLGDAKSMMKFKDYQIGDQWNRLSVNSKADLKGSDSLKLIYNNIIVTGLKMKTPKGRLTITGAGTGFYLGIHEGEHIVATAQHVFTNNKRGLLANKACENYVFHFPDGEKTFYEGKRLIYQSEEFDFAFCAIKVSENDDNMADRQGLNFDFSELYLGTALNTMGFGIHKKEKLGIPSMDNSLECQIILGHRHSYKLDGKRYLGTSCDASPADSGSPLVKKKSAKVVGIMSSVNPIRQNYSVNELKQLVGTQNEINLYPELSHMVSALDIGQELKVALSFKNLRADDREILNSILDFN